MKHTMAGWRLPKDYISISRGWNSVETALKSYSPPPPTSSASSSAIIQREGTRGSHVTDPPSASAKMRPFNRLFRRLLCSQDLCLFLFSILPLPRARMLFLNNAHPGNRDFHPLSKLHNRFVCLPGQSFSSSPKLYTVFLRRFHKFSSLLSAQLKVTPRNSVHSNPKLMAEKTTFLILRLLRNKTLPPVGSHSSLT